MRYYLDTTNNLKLFKSPKLIDNIDLKYLKYKESKIYLKIIERGLNSKLRPYIKVELLIQNDSTLIVYLSYIMFNLIKIEDYDYELLDGRFN